MAEKQLIDHSALQNLGSNMANERPDSASCPTRLALEKGTLQAPARSIEAQILPNDEIELLDSDYHDTQEQESQVHTTARHEPADSVQNAPTFPSDHPQSHFDPFIFVNEQ